MISLRNGNIHNFHIYSTLALSIFCYISSSLRSINVNPSFKKRKYKKHMSRIVLLQLNIEIQSDEVNVIHEGSLYTFHKRIVRKKMCWWCCLCQSIWYPHKIVIMFTFRQWTFITFFWLYWCLFPRSVKIWYTFCYLSGCYPIHVNKNFDTALMHYWRAIPNLSLWSPIERFV